MERTPKPSARVAQVLEAGGTPALDGLVAIMGGKLPLYRGRGPHRFLDVWAGERHVQVYVSPTGRSVRVYVDGQEVKR